MRKRAAEIERQKLEEAARMLEEQGKNAKFKPTVMTYNDVSKTAQPYDSDKNMQDNKDSSKYDDDDMPSEEELAVYDTDYLNDDEEDIKDEKTSEVSDDKKEEND